MFTINWYRCSRSWSYFAGSEYDSDENLDLAEEDDIMMEELGDNDVTATEDELRNQVGRAHL